MVQSLESFCVSSSLTCRAGRCVNRCRACVSWTNAFSSAVDFGSMWNWSLVSFAFFLAPCEVGWCFFCPYKVLGNGITPPVVKHGNKQTPVDSWVSSIFLRITSQYFLPIPKAGDFSKNLRGQEGTVGSPWGSVFPCSLLNGEKKELPTTCALMCHGQMVKIWILARGH